MPSGGNIPAWKHYASEIWEEYHRLGLTKRQLAERLGITRNAVDQALRRHADRHGLPRVPADPMPSGGNIPAWKHYASEIWEEYHRLGLTKHELAAQLGITPGAVDQALRRHARREGLPVPKDAPSPP